MRKNVIKKIFETNLIYTNPALTTNARKKLKSKGTVYPKLRNNVIASNIATLVLFGIFLSNFSLNVTPGVYKFMLIFATFFAFILLSGTIVNMFYESTDTLSLMTLPISEKELFIGKFFTMMIFNLGVAITIFLINIFGVINSANFTIAKLLIAIVLALLEIIIIFSSLLLVLSSITYIPNFRKHRSKIQGGVIFLTVIPGFFFGIFPHLYKNSDDVLPFTKSDALVRVITDSISAETFIVLACALVLAITISFILYKVIIKNYFTTLYKISKIERVTLSDKELAKTKEKTTLKKKLIKMNLKMMTDGSLLANQLSTILAGCFMFFFFGYSSNNEIFDVSIKYFPFAVILASLLTMVMYNTLSFSYVTNSLERGNFYMLQTFPISFKKYLKLKLTLAIIGQLLLTLPLLLAILLYLKASISFILCFIPSFIITSIAFSFFGFASDYKKLNLTWNNIMELGFRSVNKVAYSVIGTIIMFVGIGLTFLTYFLIYKFEIASLILTPLYCIVLIVVVVLCYLRLKKLVWNKVTH